MLPRIDSERMQKTFSITKIIEYTDTFLVFEKKGLTTSFLQEIVFHGKTFFFKFHWLVKIFIYLFQYCVSLSLLLGQHLIFEQNSFGQFIKTVNSRIVKKRKKEKNSEKYIFAKVICASNKRTVYQVIYLQNAKRLKRFFIKTSRPTVASDLILAT